MLADELSGWAGTAGLVGFESQFLAQKNGFQVQVQAFRPA